VIDGVGVALTPIDCVTVGVTDDVGVTLLEGVTDVDGVMDGVGV